MTAGGGREGRLGGRGGIKQKGKRTGGHGQQCGDCQGEEGIKGLKGNGKNTIKIKFKKKNSVRNNSQNRVTQMSINKRVNKQTKVHPCNGILLSNKK